MPSEARISALARRRGSLPRPSLSPGVLASPDVHDLVFSYLRLGDPRLKSAAIAAIRAMAAEPRFRD